MDQLLTIYTRPGCHLCQEMKTLVERVVRDTRAAGVMAPTTDMLYDFIGKAVCGMELF